MTQYIAQDREQTLAQANYNIRRYYIDTSFTIYDDLAIFIPTLKFRCEK